MQFQSKKWGVFLFGFIFLTTPFISRIEACTRALWSNNGIAIVVGRTLDWMEDMKTNLWVFPRGIDRKGLTPENPLQWTSQYGSVVASAYDIASADGMNEKGLGANLLWLDESNYGKRNSKLPGLSISLWAQYFLDNFATVNEAINAFQKHPFQPVTAKIGKTQLIATVHLTLEDATGDSAVIEYIDGKPKIYHGKEYTVMTNSPTFEKQLKNLKDYEGFGGKKPLPGTTSPEDRFVRASYYTNRLAKPMGTREAIAGIMSVIRNVSQPFIISDGKKPYTDATLWRTILDLTHKVYYFESTTSPSLVWIDLDDMQLDKGSSVMKLDLVGNPDLIGDVAKKFVPAKSFEFIGPME